VRTPVFTAREVLQFAVKNEEDGEAFYRKIAKYTTVAAVRKLFLMLAKEEVRHLGIFKQMLSEVDERETITTDPGEYVDYMIAYYTADILFSANRAKELPASPHWTSASGGNLTPSPITCKPKNW
jgi:rubrerythrin